MTDFRFIEFEKKRDFSEKINATFSFATQNFKGLFRSLLYIGGPPTLVASMLFSSFFTDIFSMGIRAGDPDLFASYLTSPNFWVRVIAACLFFITAVVVVTATSYNYMLLYREKKSNQIEVHEVWERVRETFWMYLGTSVLFGLVAVISYFVLMLPMFILGAISPFLIFFGMLFMICGIFYLYVGASLVFVIRAFEKKGFIDAIRRSFHLIRDKWWSTAGNMFVLSMLVGVFSSIFFVPAYVIMIVQTLQGINEKNFQGSDGGILGIITLILITCYYLSQLILASLPNIGLAFQYFNLVEMKEARGLMGEIETFGKPQDAPRPPEDY
ncbi:MAG TPA: hypothetical protein VG737_16880 [Cyclobacteriaceae bacterium]|nr:hypothetical protein [Cyclobacteriaceae bacterium]